MNTLLAAVSPLLSQGSIFAAKTASISSVYIVTAALSLLMLVGYLCVIRKKDAWNLLLFSAVFVVDFGYLLLSVAPTLSAALFANRLSYLGSVFLPVAMLMIIFNAIHLHYPKWLAPVLITVGIGVFLVAASPGYLDIYYREVTLEIINGTSVLRKEYGPWHKLYLVYLLCCFVATIYAVSFAIVKKRTASTLHSVVLAIAVFVNIGVWLLEQLVAIDFEFLSVSYIISELFLLGLYLMIQEAQYQEEELQKRLALAEQTAVAVVAENDAKPTAEWVERCRLFAQRIPDLTPTERTIYGFYVEGKTTKEILKELNITENTLKYHNKNIYGKLGVSSRKQLREIAAALPTLSEE